jgi:hypothetical protein
LRYWKYQYLDFIDYEIVGSSGWGGIMFGMLDYRANKLYIILFCIPLLILILFSMFGLPIIHYMIGLKLFDARIFQIISSLVSLIIVEMIWTFFVVGVVAKLFQFVFTLFVDVIPHDGRTKEEAQEVVWGGEKAIILLELQKHPKKWRENVEEEFAKIDWVQNLFFKDRIIERILRAKEHFEFDDEKDVTAYNPYKLENFVKENNLEVSGKEKFVCNSLYRRWFVGYSFFLFLLIFNPFS